jgi:hypothetical protein
MSERFRAQSLGLTEREAHILLACCNGVILHQVGPDVLKQAEGCANYLAACVSSSAEVAAGDIAHLGVSLDFPHSGTAETPLEFFDLAEKIAAMPDEVALCLLWWATGFWNGIEEVQRA